MNTKLLSLLAATFMLTACGAHQQTASPMPPMTPAQAYTEPEQKYANPGSLYSEAGNTNLYEDNRARRVGDIVLVKVVENSKSKSKADTTTDKTSTSEYGVSAAFGRASINPIAGIAGPSGGVGINPMLSTNSSSGLKATGETKRENFVTATVAARVLQVLPGGVLQLEGAREIRVNEETQYMVVSGLVRASDVAGDNSVESTQLADSRISYYGKGVLAEKQRPGWLSRLLENVWPF